MTLPSEAPAHPPPPLPDKKRTFPYKLPLTKNCRCSLYYNVELPLLGLLEIFIPTVLTQLVQLRYIRKMQTTWS